MCKVEQSFQLHVASRTLRKLLAILAPERSHKGVASFSSDAPIVVTTAVIKAWIALLAHFRIPPSKWGRTCNP